MPPVLAFDAASFKQDAEWQENIKIVDEIFRSFDRQKAISNYHRRLGVRTCILHCI